jgi:hypothetical protein
MTHTAKPPHGRPFRNRTRRNPFMTTMFASFAQPEA